MSDYDRGPYTPPSDRLAFDPREPVRSGGPAPVTLIVSAVILAAIIGGLFVVYHAGVKHKPGSAETVGRPAPIAQAANVAAPSQLTIDKSDDSLAALPSAPPASNAAPLAAVAGPPPVAPTTSAATPTPAAATTPAATPARAGVAQPTAPVARSTAPSRPAKPLTIASIADAAVAGQPAPLRPAVRADAAAATTPTGFWAQVGAFSTPALAEKGWGDVAASDRRDMAGKRREIQSTIRGGRTYYRAIVTGFASEAAARAFCGKLTAAHKPCIAH